MDFDNLSGWFPRWNAKGRTSVPTAVGVIKDALTRMTCINKNSTTLIDQTTHK